MNKFTEYLTENMAELLKYTCRTEDDKKKFSVANQSLYHEVAHMAECVVCGGRDFFGLQCQKCLEGVYNIGIGFCEVCETARVLGACCSGCKTNKYMSFTVKCLNPRKVTIYTMIHIGIICGMTWYRRVLMRMLGVRT